MKPSGNCGKFQTWVLPSRLCCHTAFDIQTPKCTLTPSLLVEMHTVAVFSMAQLSINVEKKGEELLMRGLCKYPVDPTRIRQIPRQFGAIDREFIFGEHIRRLTPEETALYALLVCVSDPQGLSYYSDRRLGELLGLSMEEILRARLGLLRTGLILYEHPMYQLLDLPELP